MATLYQVIKALESVALEQPNIRYVGENDLYEDLNANPNIQYSVFYVTQNTHTSTDEWDYYGLNLFVLDRLKNDKSNELEIESYAKETLDNIIGVFCERYNAEVVGERTYQVFTEKFVDSCCGVYVNVRLQLPKNIICYE